MACLQQAIFAIDAAYRSISKARESVDLNREMQRLEILTIEKGASDLLLLNVREAATFDARLSELDALLQYFESQADYRAAMALDVAEFNLNRDPVLRKPIQFPGKDERRFFIKQAGPEQSP